MLTTPRAPCSTEDHGPCRECEALQEVEIRSAPKTFQLFNHTAHLDECSDADLEGDYSWGILIDPSSLWALIDCDTLTVEMYVPSGPVQTSVSVTYEFPTEGIDVWQRPRAEIELAEKTVMAELQAMGEVGMVMILGLRHAADYPPAPLSDEEG